VFGVGVLCGMAVSGGYWYLLTWKMFGNPLFPQFGNYFPNLLAAPVSIADPTWIPKETWQQLLWPFIISVDAKMAGQIGFRQIIWSIGYALLIGGLGAWIWTKLARVQITRPLSQPHKFILVVVVVGFLFWMKLFGVYRYLVPIELLAPLMIFLVLLVLFKYRAALRGAVLLIGISVATVLFGGLQTWGHKGWASRPYYADVPDLLDPGSVTVLISEGDPAWSWLAASFPKEVAFAQIVGNFPQGPRFKEHVQSMVESRGSQAFALFKGRIDLSSERAERLRLSAMAWGLTSNERRCTQLAWVVSRLKGLKAEVKLAATPTDEAACTLESTVKPDADVDAENQVARQTAARVLTDYGFAMDANGCSLHRSGVGDQVEAFYWCPAQLARGNGR
jgi:hypothetical protein